MRLNLKITEVAMFYKMPIIFLIIILAVISFGSLIPVEIKQILYALSLTIKSLIIFLLPLVIFGLLFKMAVNLTHHATRIILFILGGVICSNFIATFLSHYIGSLIYHLDLSITLPKDTSMLQAAWIWGLPQLIANNKAMFGGIGLGMFLSLINVNVASRMATKLELLVTKILQLFIYLIPLFVTGYLIKLQADGVIMLILKDYALIFVLIASTQFIYITLAYLVLNRGKMLDFLNCIKNMLPAALSGFSTMSSAASMPLTIIGVENNTRNKTLARAVVPATVNIHLLGDCFAIPIFAFAVLKTFGIAEPTLISYLIFTFYFVLAKFSVAAVPGGGIIVMLPILESYLGFNTNMLSLMTALYVLFDPVITCVNILGNGAFAKMIDQLSGLTLDRHALQHLPQYAEK
ncbi:MAG TPA: cation:dicarboxylase symporter family transporter [Gammaproteobacteria bacterium]|nr:cation:dicarboxylase symporter family transporter [Gammaproteobacteria bacterium]